MNCFWQRVKSDAFIPIEKKNMEPERKVVEQKQNVSLSHRGIVEHLINIKPLPSWCSECPEGWSRFPSNTTCTSCTEFSLEIWKNKERARTGGNSKVMDCSSRRGEGVLSAAAAAQPIESSFSFSCVKSSSSPRHAKSFSPSEKEDDALSLSPLFLKRGGVIEGSILLLRVYWLLKDLRCHNVSSGHHRCSPPPPPTTTTR